MEERLSLLQERLLFSESNHAFAPSHLVNLTAHFMNLFYLQDGRTRFSGTSDDLRRIVEELLIVTASYGVDMETAVWSKYPGQCSYCNQCPCICGLGKSRPSRQLELPVPAEEILSLGYLQAMLGNIYPKNRHSLHEAVEHVVEEIGEALDVITLGDRQEASKEFADIFAWMIQVANALNISITRES